MRQVISWRFVATIGALVVLALFVWVAFADRGTIAEVVERSDPQTRRADLVAIVLDTEHEGFSMSPTGQAIGELSLHLVPEERTARVFPGTPGEVTCPDLDEPCVLVAETLGDSITWFALLPLQPFFQFELPAIESLDGGYANLVNGWQLPYAPVIDRTRCEETYPAESFSEFLRLAGEDHRAIYSFGAGAITDVAC